MQGVQGFALAPGRPALLQPCSHRPTRWHPTWTPPHRPGFTTTGYPCRSSSANQPAMKVKASIKKLCEGEGMLLLGPNI